MFGSKFSNTVQMSNSEFDKWVRAATRNGLAHVTPSDDMMLCYVDNEHIGTYFPETEILYTDDASLFGSYVESVEVDPSKSSKENYNKVLKQMKALKESTNTVISEAPSGGFRNVCKDYLNGDMDVADWMDYAFEAMLECVSDPDIAETIDSNEDEILDVFGEDPQYYIWWKTDDLEKFTQGAWSELRRIIDDGFIDLDDGSVEATLKEMFPELSGESLNLLADWYSNEGADPEDVTKDDVKDLIWASSYNDEEVRNLIDDLINCGYFDEDDMPDEDPEGDEE